MMFAQRFAGPALAAALLVAAPMAGPAQAAVASGPTYAPGDWKPVDPQNLLVIDTTKGRILVEMVPVVAPEHVDRIKALAHRGFYDGLKFFRVVTDFMAQTGDPANTGAGVSGETPLKGTFDFRRGPDTPFSGVASGALTAGFVGPLPAASQADALMGFMADGKVRAFGLFCAGVAGMARTSNPDSAATQFFLMRQDNHSLDNQYTPWGRVLIGLDVVRALNVGEPPALPDVMSRVRIAADLPAAERPNLWRIDTASAAFRARLAAESQAAKPGSTLCSLEVPAELRK